MQDIPDGLSPDLTRIVQAKQAASIQKSLYQDLAVRIRALLESNHPEGQQLNVDYALEDDFTCQAIVENPSKIHLALGLEDLFVELELDKANEFCERKVVLLQKREAMLQDEETRLRKDIGLLAEALKKALRPSPG